MNPIDELKRLLDQVSTEETHKAIIDVFNSIADLLLNKVCIKKGEDKYAILEIEFYHSTFGDKITFQRNAIAGEWFFHNYGMDLCFKSDDKTYGGILIRSISNIDVEDDIIIGPGRVVDRLFTVYNAFENIDYEQNMPRILSRDNQDITCVAKKSTHRYHIDEKESIYKLRFIVQDFDELEKKFTRKADKDYFDPDHIGNSLKTYKEKKSNNR